MNSRQLGRFSIDESLVREHPDRVTAILVELRAVPVKAEVAFHRFQIDYMALSPRFREVDSGSEPPWYDLEIDPLSCKLVGIKERV
jgi:hypothetical protein